MKTINIFLERFGVKIIRTSNNKLSTHVKFSGDYASWQDAMKDSRGYDDPNIFEKVRESALKVKEGEKVYERDSVLFDRIEYSWPLLSALMWVAAQNKGNLHVMDFGGALGTSYFQNRKFLIGLSNVHWAVIEQEKFVEIGKKEFEDEKLKFYYSIDELCENSGKPNIVLLSGVLQYIEDPYEKLRSILLLGVETIVIDIFPITDSDRDRLTVEYVPETIYSAIYPAWFFCKSKLLSIMYEYGYEMIEEFPAYVGGQLYLSDGTVGRDIGFIFKKKFLTVPDH